MRFVGLTEVASFVLQCPDQSEVVRAWLTEMRHRTWVTAASLLSDFPNADASRPPDVVFHLAAGSVRIETIIDFRTGVVLLTRIHHPTMTLAYPS